MGGLDSRIGENEPKAAMEAGSAAEKQSSPSMIQDGV